MKWQPPKLFKKCLYLREKIEYNKIELVSQNYEKNRQNCIEVAI